MKLRILLLASLILPFSSSAEEGGTGHFIPGNFANLIDLPPTKPGWVIKGSYLNYQGDISLGRDLPVAGLTTLGLDAELDVALLGGFYTFEKKVLESHFSVGAFIPYAWMDVTAEVRVPTTGNTVLRNSNASGLSDIILLPIIMAWECGAWQFDAVLPIYAPTGDYEVGRLANPGLNHWTFDPTVGVAYNNEKIGFNFAAHAGIAFATENNDTNYQNGEVFHLDTSIQQLLPLGPGFLGIGIEAYYYKQFTGDSGLGAARDLKGETMGLGPVLTYLLPCGNDTIAFEASWLKELDTTNRLEGSFFWAKAIYQF